MRLNHISFVAVQRATWLALSMVFVFASLVIACAFFLFVLHQYDLFVPQYLLSLNVPASMIHWAGEHAFVTPVMLALSSLIIFSMAVGYGQKPDAAEDFTAYCV